MYRGHVKTFYWAGPGRTLWSETYKSKYVAYLITRFQAWKFDKFGWWYDVADIVGIRWDVEDMTKYEITNSDNQRPNTDIG